MSADIRICPHCGASVSGDTEQCPGCDAWLDRPDEEEAEILMLRRSVAPPTDDAEALSDQSLAEEATRDPIETSASELADDEPPAVDTEPDAEVSAGDGGVGREETPKPASLLEFENAHTAPLPPSDTPLTASHPRPLPVPDPEPLPVMDTQPKVSMPSAITISPAPFTLPPEAVSPPTGMPPTMAGVPSQDYWLQQRVQAYLYGGYQLVHQKQHEAVLSYGKSLSFFWWIIGAMSVVGLLWYWFILLLSGFRRDIVYVSLEPDGSLYEEGSGAAHIRRRRSRIARRWGVMAMLLAMISVFTFCLVILAGAVLMDRYETEIDAAYPEFSLFGSREIDSDALDATQVQNVKVVVLVLIILMGLSGVGFVGGMAMFIVSYLHAAAYRVDVAPLPDLR